MDEGVPHVTSRHPIRRRTGAGPAAARAGRVGRRGERPHVDGGARQEAVLRREPLDAARTVPCAICHGPAVGWTGPDQAINKAGSVYEGAVAGRFGDRKPPAAAYAGDSPTLHFDGEKWVGGMFWDGRATGWTLGRPLAEQSQGPFLNPVEMNNASPSGHRRHGTSFAYADLFARGLRREPTGRCRQGLRRDGLRSRRTRRSRAVNPFNSRFDAYWRGQQARLTGQEELGPRLSSTARPCASACHLSEPGMDGIAARAVHRPHVRQPRHPGRTREVGRLHRTATRSTSASAASSQAAGVRRDGLGGRECGKFKVPDAAQRRQRPSMFSEAVRPQRLLRQPLRHRALLQHARRRGRLAGARGARTP